MDTKIIEHGSVKLCFSSPDGERWFGVTAPPQTEADRRSLVEYIEGDHVQPMFFSKGLIDALETGADPRAENVLDWLAENAQQYQGERASV